MCLTMVATIYSDDSLGPSPSLAPALPVALYNEGLSVEKPAEQSLPRCGREASDSRRWTRTPSARLKEMGIQKQLLTLSGKLATP